MEFKNKTVFITGGSRGIGKAIGLRLAKEGANIVIAAKSTVENPKLGGTIFTAAEEMNAAGGKGLAIQCDIRFEDQIINAVDKGAEYFGGIDILINNASAINLSSIEKIESKHYDLMQNVNVRGTILTSKYCIPHLKKSDNPHILTLSPPLNFDPKWFSNHAPYTISKFGMTMAAMGLAHELKKYAIASNTLWPQTTIATAAVMNLLGGQQLINMSRTTEIIADAAYFIFCNSSKESTGNNFIDEAVLQSNGITDFSKYSVIPGAKLYTDLFL
ncbi:MAG: NAD(P)-dependent oxidoreductase [Ginsengibacter sp.]